MEDQPPIPKRIVWFAPWTWKPWQIFVACLLLAFAASVVSDIAWMLIPPFDIYVFDTYIKLS